MARYAKNHKNSTSLRHGHNSIKTKRGRSSYNKVRYARTKTHSYKKRGRKPSLFTAKHYNYSSTYVNTTNVQPVHNEVSDDNVMMWIGLGIVFIFVMCMVGLMSC